MTNKHIIILYNFGSYDGTNWLTRNTDNLRDVLSLLEFEIMRVACIYQLLGGVVKYR